MSLDDQLQKMKDISPIVPREEKIRETIRRSKEVYFQQEQEALLTYWGFLWSQFRYTRKRWWALQGALLLFAGQAVPGMERDLSRVRSLGVIGCLFVVFAIPELWRNRESDSTQVEAACLYSLRQIYAARIVLFGIVDVFLLTLFCCALHSRSGLTAVEVLAQFLLPVTITAGICFHMLRGGGERSETVSLGLCLFFCALWWLILMNERIYLAIVPSVWVALFTMALAFLAWAVHRTVTTTNQYWEVDLYEIAAN